MPDPTFSVHVEPGELAGRELAAAVSRPDAVTGLPGRRPATGDAAARHGRRDARLAARQRSERDHAGRATGGSARSYAFRRS
ncbi:hypothetical protein GCM10020358_54810 [Amorphoplanes nipponensis]|uniref:Uncharacterized protein n=1 Tax=Actinoplanes nipponensis TaxID=135950 RepID=A0A919MYC6_9ACTN|nr:hypothetical protein [Actinoplanes nipponensis]GIE54395.1 hypothetical protein Ani05nite_79290 [Actinoplanes nipponensis]